MKIDNILFLDIETAPMANVGDLFTPVPEDYETRFKRELESIDTELGQLEHYATRAALYAEHGQIVSISVGKMVNSVLYVRTFTSANEKEILINFLDAVGGRNASNFMCAHNGFEFDFPFLFRRLIIHGLPIPVQLNMVGVKPWDTRLLDTMEIWSHRSWKYRITLDLLAKTLGIQSPKQGITGADVASLFFAGDFESIKNYNAADVIALARVYSKLTSQGTITDDQINLL